MASTNSIKHSKLPEMDELNALFIIVSGVLCWRSGAVRSINRVTEAGTKIKKGYFRIVIDGKSYLRHRIVWAMTNGRDPANLQIDHRNNTPGNDWPENLRVAKNQQNLCNRGKNLNNKSGYKGVCWCAKKMKWRSTITSHGKQRHLGYFDDPEIAHLSYVDACKELHGEFSRHT